MRILLTGHRGYIGAVVAPLLADAGHEVHGLDAGYYDEAPFGSAASAARYLTRELVKDIRDVNVADLAGMDAVVHLAALSNDPLGELRPALTEAINTYASLGLAMRARDAHVSRFVFASSCSIYGEGAGTSLTETDPLRPLTAYARSKVIVEDGLKALADSEFSPVFLRNATAFGYSPMLRLDLVVNNLVASAWATGEVKLLSDGRAWRPIVHVQDIAGAILTVLTASREAVHNQAFNVGRDDQNFQVRDIAEAVRRGVPGSRVTFGGDVSSDSRTYHVNFSKIRRTFPEFAPQWTLEGGIAELSGAFQTLRLAVDDLDSPKYTRLLQLKRLIDGGRLDESLRWTNAPGEPLTAPAAG